MIDQFAFAMLCLLGGFVIGWIAATQYFEWKYYPILGFIRASRAYVPEEWQEATDASPGE